MLKLLIIILCCVVLVNSHIALELQPCNEYDDACITNTTRNIYKKVMEGDTTIGLKTSDPMFKKVIVGNLLMLDYTFKNTTLTGFRNCEFSRSTLHLKKSLLRSELVCPFLFLVGDYDIKGSLLGLVPVEGHGDYSIKARGYRGELDIDIAFITGKDGQQHLKFRSFRVNSVLDEGMVVDFKNLFDGNKQLSDAVHNFANQNWKPVFKAVEEPVVHAFLKKLFKNHNKILLHIPAETIVVL